MLQLQKSIYAVGLFSIFEAHLQCGLRCQNGFKEAKKRLEDAGRFELREVSECISKQRPDFSV